MGRVSHHLENAGGLGRYCSALDHLVISNNIEMIMYYAILVVIIFL